MMDGSKRESSILLNILLKADSFISLQVNHLSTALVSFLLLPNMVKAAELHQSKSRLVIVCSETHFWVNLSDVISAPNLLQTMNDKQYCTPEKGMAHRYPDTKCM